MRDPAFENKEVFQNYKYLRSPLTHQSEVILGILDSLQVNTKYAIIYETRDGNDKLAKQIISSAGNKTRASNVFEAETPIQ
ncbi:hypothetical protein OS493_034070 [Desmophyllum pertusum]|uniref:Uncharacterized protein n=1 Tax=Desmophyllum pertusum TaxID=174260 RepID=A0A9W9YVD7_9CNID|nr:hypothetical protein OS493_034070 [Desmophyllum pertusum]